MIEALHKSTLAFTYVNNLLTIATFHACWAVSVLLSAPKDGVGNFESVANLMAEQLPSHMYSFCTMQAACLPLRRFFQPPRALQRSFYVARPDLYWYVASAWYRIMHKTEVQLDVLETATDSVVEQRWQFDAGTQAWRDLIGMMQRAQICAVKTEPRATPDIVVNGHGSSGVSLAKRDKMLLALLLMWSDGVNWALHSPHGAPKPLVTFIDIFK